MLDHQSESVVYNRPLPGRLIPLAECRGFWYDQPAATTERPVRKRPHWTKLIVWSVLGAVALAVWIFAGIGAWVVFHG
jgi:hypothetical protein